MTALYYSFPHRFRWILLLVGSYYFYFYWKAEYLLLIFLTTLISYSATLLMEKSTIPLRRKRILILALSFHIGVLFLFKYLDFFTHSLKSLLNRMNLFYDVPFFQILQPIGVSFYTFKNISYCIDVYRGHQQAENHLGRVALYIAFFPQLLAGPIERAKRLLPQFDKKFRFDYQRIADGLKWMLWGFFQKMVIADNLAILVDSVYNQPYSHQGLSLLLATLFYSFQIYCDFSGYSDIAIGVAQVLGFKTMKNFNRPYFSPSLREFWRGWHISLSSWFRDYLYIPLGGRYHTALRWYVNLFIVFLICGFWHGANWTFITWGALHGFYLVSSLATQDIRKSLCRWSGLDKIPRLHRMMQVLMTYCLVCFAWIFFRANTLSDVYSIIVRLFAGWGKVLHKDFIHTVPFFETMRFELIIGSFSILVFVLVEKIKGEKSFPEMISRKPVWIRWSAYYGLLFTILFCGVFHQKQFIYFQF